MTIGGSDMEFVSAIIVIDFQNVSRWAEKLGIAFTTYEEDMSVDRTARDKLWKNLAFVALLLVPMLSVSGPTGTGAYQRSVRRSDRAYRYLCHRRSRLEYPGRRHWANVARSCRVYGDRRLRLGDNGARAWLHILDCPAGQRILDRRDRSAFRIAIIARQGLLSGRWRPQAAQFIIPWVPALSLGGHYRRYAPIK